MSSSSSSSSFVPLEGWTCISQGAEARLWLIPNYLKEGTSAIAKERFSKKYRHAVLDARLLRQRCRAEAKCLIKCRRAGIPCPALWGVQPPVLYLQHVGNTTVRAHLEHTQNIHYTALATQMGSILAKLHTIGVVHGDLTTSNMMIQEKDNDGEYILTLIDFGLARVSCNPEELAVDLYVLERALLSTHPELEDLKFLDQVLCTYKKECPKSDAILQRLSQVRLRGRKRECFG